MCLFAPCTRLQFNDKFNGQIAQNRCYKLVRYYSTELESKNKTFFFSFLCGGKIKIE